MVTDRARGVDTPAPPERERGRSTASNQHQLRRHIFGGVPHPLDKNGNEQPLYIALFSGKRKLDGAALHSTTSQYFKWPEQSAEATRWIQSHSRQRMEVYHCAHLVTSRRRVKANAAQMMALYVDGDGAKPGPGLPQPTAVVESSPGRHQFYWRLTRAIDPVVGEQLNKRLANAMQADMSGWDLTQLLRPPDTQNWKYENGPTVQLISIEDRAYDPDELDRILPSLPAEATRRAEVKLERRPTTPPIGNRDQRARERMYAAKRGSEIQMLANGGSVKSKPEGGPDHSADDQSYANALAFWFDKDSSRIAAEMWRSNRVRDKWNEVHFSDGSTYLEATIGKAIGACSQSFRDLRGHDAGDDPPQPQLAVPEQPTAAVECSPTLTQPPANGPTVSPIPGEPTTLEAAHAEIMRLRRRALDQDDRIDDLTGIIAVNQGVIAETRAELEDKTGFITTIGDVIAKPNAELSAGEKIVSIGLLIETQFRAAYGPYTLPDGTEGSYRLENGNIRMPLSVIARRTGYSPNRVSDLGRQVAERENAPYAWHNTREWKTRFDGTDGWVTTIEIEPRAATTAEALQAIALLSALPTRPKHGGSHQATEARERVRRGCEHQDDPVIISGCCAICGDDLGDRRITAQEWEALKHQLGVSEVHRPPVDALVPIGHQVGVSDGETNGRLPIGSHAPPVAPAATLPLDTAWMSEWPEHPPDTTGFQYDDVGIGAIAGGEE